uniref:RNase H type-1 domain-containing protein n=1 Tax=Salarias fasciatus TaxID=181472 RepID=A0A672HI74_SALFA
MFSQLGTGETHSEVFSAIFKRPSPGTRITVGSLTSSRCLFPLTLVRHRPLHGSSEFSRLRTSQRRGSLTDRYDTEVEYAQNQKVAAGQSLVERQHCDCTEQSNIKPLLVTTQTLSSPHHHHDEDVCQGLPRVYVHGCSFHHDSQLRAGVGIVWIGQNGDLPSHFQLSPKTNQYAETPAVLTALQQAAKLSITQLVLCSTLNYARHSSTSHLPTGTANGMRNAWNKDVKQSKLFSTCNQLVTDKGMVVDPERVKGHSHVTGPDKAGDDEAEHLTKLGVKQGTRWEFHD